MSSSNDSKRPPPPGAIEIRPIANAGDGSRAGAIAAPAVKARRSVFSWLPWILALVIVGAVVWAFVSIRPVVVKTQPVAGSLHLTGGQAWRSGETWYLTAGKWQLTADAQGHYPLAKELTVSRTGLNEFFFEFEPLPGKLTVTAVDRVSGEAVNGFSYTVNGEVGEAELEIPPGAAAVVVEHEDYLSATTAIEIEGFAKRQELVVELTPRVGVIAVSKILPEIAVWVAGERQGLGPGEWEFEPGDYLVELRRSGFQPWAQEVTVTAGERTVIEDVKLVPTPGTVTFLSEPPGAQVLLDNAIAGLTPFTRELAPGVYGARAVLAGYRPQDQLLDLKPGAEVELKFELSQITGKLTVVAPADAEIRIDGEVWQGTWPVELPLGPHRVEGRFAGLPPVARTVVIRPDRDVTLTLTPPPPPEKTAETPTTEPTERPSTALGIETIIVRAPQEPFQIGSPRGAPNRRANEALRSVRLTRDYHLGVAEITNAQFAKFDAAHQSGTDLGGAQQPVVDLTWDQAARYCNYLSELDGLPPAYREVGGSMRAIWPISDGWRLPTEAEWELAAQLGAPANSPYPWGTALPPKAVVANLADESKGGAAKIEGYDDKHASTAPVKTFPANGFGLFDVAGNVGEWCHDYYSLSSGDPTRIEVDAAGPERGLHHVVKGSSYQHYQAAKLRIAFRDYSSSKRNDVGFRVARYVTDADR